MFRYLLILAWLLLSPLPLQARTLAGECAIRFFGDSTLHDFEGGGACLPFELVLDEGSGRQGRVEEARIRVPVAGLDTGIGARDRQMRGMFEGSAYPWIEAHVASLRPEALLASWQDAEAPHLEFALQIRDVRQPVRAAVEGLQVESDEITFTLVFELSLKSFGLKPPRVLGFIRVDDQVRVSVDTVIRGLPAPSSAPEKGP